MISSILIQIQLLFLPRYESDKNKGGLLSLKIDKTFDFTKQGRVYALLSRIQSLSKTFNPFYRFLAEGGSSPFPGHYWQTYVPVSGDVGSEIPYIPIE